MSDIASEIARSAVHIPEILLPSPGVNPSTWSVVACDQYSSEREYWERVSSIVGEAPSTLRLIYPECYLEDGDKAQRVGRIQDAMASYLEKSLLTPAGAGFVLVERYTPYEKEARLGLMISVDLEKYRYGLDSTSLIRPTEGTILERLPPRMEIRRGASLELPHIMLLVDDPEGTVIEPIYRARATLKKLYDIELMTGAGRVSGWKVGEEGMLAQVAKALEKLGDPDAFEARYGNRDVLLFAVGDGNHSLATAKAIWEETKASLAPGDPLRESHPARYALVELVNLHDKGLPFHPIHRVLFGAEEGDFLAGLSSYAAHRVHRFQSAEAAFEAVSKAPKDGAHRVALVSPKGASVLEFSQPKANLPVATIQEYIDAFRQARPAVGIDYIHGDESLLALATRPGNLGLYLPPIEKESFFGTVISQGVMPRKTFSMGEALEKRFYVEARRISV